MILLYVITIIIAVLLSLFMVYYFMIRKWDCVNGVCKKQIGGKYVSKNNCKKECNINNSTLELPQNSPMNKWACTNDYNCVKAEKGWDSFNNCMINCKKPEEKIYKYYYPMYYPQSLYYRRPRYWRYNRFGRPRRHNHKKKN